MLKVNSRANRTRLALNFIARLQCVVSLTRIEANQKPRSGCVLVQFGRTPKALANSSPGLLQPWVSYKERVQTLKALANSSPALLQPWVSYKERVQTLKALASLRRQFWIANAFSV